MRETMNIVFFGAGPVGSTVGGWVSANHPTVYFLDQGAVAEALRDRGLTLYEQNKQRQAETIPVKVISSLAEVDEPDVVVVCVKNYSLDAVSRMIQDAYGDQPIIVGLQNGIENQKVLPKYFSQVLFGIVCYNTWMDEPGVVGYQKRGPIVLGTPDNSLRFEAGAVARVFNKGVETVVTDHLMDAALSKMIINLTNSLTTLIGHQFRPLSDPGLFQKLLSNLTYEGVQIVKAAGYSECSLGGMPGWKLLELSAKLPQFITKPLFDMNVKKMVVSSMAQDVIQRGSRDNELETINGTFIRLADEHGLDAPYNRTIFRLCQERFAAEKFETMDVKEVWAEVQKAM
jgi:2-dehydropantoate 2-reductase